MFSGMGTIRLGFEQAGWECVYSIEWDKHKRKIYEVIFGNEPEGSDIRAVRHNDIPRADCWTFGAPCQDFSIAGTRSGLEGHRSSLIREVFRLIRETKEEYRPEWLLYENVKGMLSSNKGLDYLEILLEMESLGYDIEWQILNSKNFGVPQNRERVFTLGHSRKYGGRKIFPITESCGLHNEPCENRKEAHETALCLTKLGQMNWTGSFVMQIGNCMPTKTRENPNQGRIYDIDGISPCLNKMEGGGREPLIYQESQGVIIKPISFTRKKIKYGIKVANTLQAAGPSRGLGNNNPITGVMVTEATKKGYAEAYEGDSINLAMPNSQTRRGRVGVGVANTLDTSCNQGTLSNGRIRRLTPRECMRLQGVPDYITDKLIEAKISDTQMYRAAGDACTRNVIYEIAKRMNVSE